MTEPKNVLFFVIFCADFESVVLQRFVLSVSAVAFLALTFFDFKAVSQINNRSSSLFQFLLCSLEPFRNSAFFFLHLNSSAIAQATNHACHYWIGLYDFDDAQGYAWTDSSPYNFQFWLTGMSFSPIFAGRKLAELFRTFI